MYQYPKQNTSECTITPTFVVIGGGIAGVSCSHELARLHPRSNVVLITESKTVVGASSIFRITEHLDEVTVFERSTDKFSTDNPSIKILTGRVVAVDYKKSIVYTCVGVAGASDESPHEQHYNKLCICTGAKSHVIMQHPNIVGLRDQSSVEELMRRLQGGRKIVVVGNGGIALELIHELTFCDVDWIVKDAYVGSAFFDASASEFIMPSLLSRASNNRSAVNNADTTRTSSLTVELATTGIEENHAGTIKGTDRGIGSAAQGGVCGAALGPEWVTKTSAAAFLAEHRQQSNNKNTSSDSHKSNGEYTVQCGNTLGNLKIHFSQEVQSISENCGTTWHSIPTLSKSEYQVSHANIAGLSGGCGEGGGCGCVDTATESLPRDYPLYIRTTTGEVIGCDFVVSATGVMPQNSMFAGGDVGGDGDLGNDLKLQYSNEGYICVDGSMHTNIPNVFAAGDCCLFTPPHPAAHFFQMRLWSQAHWMGVYAAHSMLNCIDDFGTDGKFELFTHITRFFGYKVVLLGRYNAQSLGDDVQAVTKSMVVTNDGVQYDCTESNNNSNPSSSSSSRTCSRNSNSVKDNIASSGNSKNHENSKKAQLEFWVRVTEGKEYIKLTVYRGKLVGALLIGDTDLEEVFENLILNALDISGIGIGLLDPEIDIADYFD